MVVDKLASYCTGMCLFPVRTVVVAGYWAYSNVMNWSEPVLRKLPLCIDPLFTENVILVDAQDLLS